MAISLIRFFTAPTADQKAPVLLIIPAERISDSAAEQLVASLSSDFRVLVMTSPVPDGDRVEPFTEDLHKELLAKGIKKITLLGAGNGAAVAQCLSQKKFVRRLVLIDACTRMAPSFFTRFVDAVERYLPLGLPLRKLSEDFDSRPFLHRIHCPSLVLCSPRSTKYVKAQSKYIWRKLPNAWRLELGVSPVTSLGVYSSELRESLAAFLQVPAKRPQKNKRSGVA